MARKIIIDTDPGQDDAVAILLALASPELDVLGITAVAGNVPLVSEITPLIIIGKLEQYDYAGATAVALVMLVISFVLLLLINGLQAWQRKFTEAPK